MYMYMYIYIYIFFSLSLSLGLLPENPARTQGFLLSFSQNHLQSLARAPPARPRQSVLLEGAHTQIHSSGIMFGLLQKILVFEVA